MRITRFSMFRNDVLHLTNRYWAMSLYEYGSALPIDTPVGSRYLGCYKDSLDERVLGLKMTTSADMTPEVSGNVLLAFKLEGKQYDEGKATMCVLRSGVEGKKNNDDNIRAFCVLSLLVYTHPS